MKIVLDFCESANTLMALLSVSQNSSYVNFL